MKYTKIILIIVFVGLAFLATLLFALSNNQSKPKKLDTSKFVDFAPVSESPPPEESLISKNPPGVYPVETNADGSKTVVIAGMLRNITQNNSGEYLFRLELPVEGENMIFNINMGNSSYMLSEKESMVSGTKQRSTFTPKSVLEIANKYENYLHENVSISLLTEFEFKNCTGKCLDRKEFFVSYKDINKYLESPISLLENTGRDPEFGFPTVISLVGLP